MISALKMQNFDVDPGTAEHDRPAPARSYSEAEVRELVRAANERGLRDGHAAGLAEGEAAAARRIDTAQVETLDAMAEGLATLLNDAKAHRAALEAQVLDFALSVCDAVFPELVRDMSRDRAAAQVRTALKMAIGSRRVTIRLNPATAATLSEELSARLDYYRMDGVCRIEPDADLHPGDVQMAWDHGSLSYAFEVVAQRILSELRDTHARAAAALTERETQNA